MPMTTHSEVDVSQFGTFARVYGSHDGDAVSLHLQEFYLHHLIGKVQFFFPVFFKNLSEMSNLIRQRRSVTRQGLENAMGNIETSWFDKVKADNDRSPTLMNTGSSCLTGLIRRRTMYVANLGDSKAVMGEERREGFVKAYSKTIGDLYLKVKSFDDPQPNASNPYGATVDITPRCRFVVFSSVGLWKNLSNQDVVDVVGKSPREGIAQLLVSKAIEEAAIKKELKYKEIAKYEASPRSDIASPRSDIVDDINVFVVYFDKDEGKPNSCRILPQHVSNIDVREYSLKVLQRVYAPSKLVKASTSPTHPL
ncbi:probable protein phosphatase 2C 25 [Rutidosis leptorrhynchoides]|uniref:probable protein phosphatase 2C 25 n=1 Tax=Rutidosis leptorrhynchoides TaxID=125765 RepID=UPI003A9939FE